MTQLQARALEVMTDRPPTTVHRLPALEEVMLRSSGDRERILFHNYDRVKGISIGWRQFPSDVDVLFCKKNGYDLSRRFTRGIAVIHNSGMIGYSYVGRDMLTVCEKITAALKSLGIPAEYDGESKIFVNGKKVSSNSRIASSARSLFFGDLKGKLFFGHGLLLFDNLDKEAHINGLFTPVKDLENVVTLRSLKPELTREDVILAIVKELSASRPVLNTYFSTEELATVRALEHKYTSDEWLISRNGFGKIEGPLGNTTDCLTDMTKGRIIAEIKE